MPATLARGASERGVSWRADASLDGAGSSPTGEAAQISYYAGRYDEAIEQCRRTLDLDPNFVTVYGWLA